VFLGWGRRPEFDATSREEGDEHQETSGASTRTPVVMLAPALLLTAAALVIGLLPSVPRHVMTGAIEFSDHEGYATSVLGTLGFPLREGAGAVGATLSSVLLGVAGAAGAVVVALLALFRDRLPSAPLATLRGALSPVVGRLRDLHSGHVSDYVAWLTVGVAAFGGVLAAALR
jgi:multicomponent Na+:H+ antiporter subunit D